MAIKWKIPSKLAGSFVLLKTQANPYGCQGLKSFQNTKNFAGLF